MCECLSYNQPQPGQSVPSVLLEAPEWSSQPTIAVDACIAPAIEYLWKQGVRTFGSCCGHNTRPPSVIVHEEGLATTLRLLACQRRLWLVGMARPPFRTIWIALMPDHFGVEGPHQQELVDYWTILKERHPS